MLLFSTIPHSDIRSPWGKKFTFIIWFWTVISVYTEYRRKEAGQSYTEPEESNHCKEWRDNDQYRWAANFKPFLKRGLAGTYNKQMINPFQYPFSSSNPTPSLLTHPLHLMLSSISSGINPPFLYSFFLFLFSIASFRQFLLMGEKKTNHVY